MSERSANLPDDPWRSPEWMQRTQLLLNSWRQFVGNELIPRTNLSGDSEQLFHAPMVVVAHGTQADPLLNYGNQAALDLWQLSLDQLIGMPSRLTAEPVHRDERARLLQRTRTHGFIDNYSGIRITGSGRRFRIHRAVVWNVVNDVGEYVGQAATFSDWTMLDS